MSDDDGSGGSDLTSVNPAQLRAVSQKLLSTTEELGSAFDDMHNFLESTYGCWGDDDTGKQFAKQYVGNYQQFVSSFTDFRSQLKDNSTYLSQAADEFEEQDTSAGQSLES